MEHRTANDYRDSTRPARVEAVSAFGFTERQARFLVNVMVHAGVFLERQYCAAACIAHGQKSHDFVAKLVERRYATVITRERSIGGGSFTCITSRSMRPSASGIIVIGSPSRSAG